MAKRHCNECGAEVLDGNDNCLFCGSTNIVTEKESVGNNNTKEQAVVEKGPLWARIVGLLIAVGIALAIYYVLGKYNGLF